MPRRVLEGKVISDKMDKTVTVLIERRYMHPVYKKFVRTSTKLAAHDENNSFKIGDVVEIEECRPISKNKSFRVITVPGPNAGRPPRQKVADVSAEEAAKKVKREAKKAEKKADARAVKAEATPPSDAKAKKAAAPKKAEKTEAKAKKPAKKKDE